MDFFCRLEPNFAPSFFLACFSSSLRQRLRRFHLLNTTLPATAKMLTIMEPCVTALTIKSVTLLAKEGPCLMSQMQILRLFEIDFSRPERLVFYLEGHKTLLFGLFFL